MSKTTKNEAEKQLAGAGMVAAARQKVIDVGGLDEADRVVYEKTVKQHPEARKAVRTYLDAAAGMVDKYRLLTITLRQLNLGPREVTVLLIGEGMSKQQASQIKQVVEMPEVAFKQFQDRVIGFRTALQLARGSDSHGNGASFSLQFDVLKQFQGFVSATDTAVFKRKRMVGVSEKNGWRFQLVITRKRGAASAVSAEPAKPAELPAPEAKAE